MPMYPIKRLLIGIDQTAADENLIMYCSALGHQLPIDKIYILHVAKTLEISPEILNKYPDLIAPVDENIKHETKFLIDKYFTPNLKHKTEIMVREGHREEIMLKEIVNKEIDLLVIGMKPKTAKTGYFGRKLAQLANCSIALISETLVKKEKTSLFKKVLVPVDFSENSRMAVELARQLSGKIGITDLYFQHVYQVPFGYHYSGKSYKEFCAIMETNARNQMKKMLKQAKTRAGDDHLLFTLDKKSSIPGAIADTLRKLKFDLVILGSKGRTEAASILMGSTAEKLISQIQTSTIIVKNKSHNMGLLEALHSL